MTKQEKITTWLQSHGFTYFRGKYSKLNDETGFVEVINEHQAEFFYDGTNAARIDEVNKAIKVALNHKMDTGETIYHVLARRAGHLKQEGKTNEQ